MSKQKVIAIPISCFLILTALKYPKLVQDSALDGLSLWYHSVLPILFPFLIISHFLYQSLTEDTSRKTEPIIYVFYAIFLGLFCGQPVGAGILSKMAEDNKVSPAVCQAILPLCNQVSPMFLFGYIYCYLPYEKVSKLNFILCLLLPYIFIAVFLYTILTKISNNKFRKTKSSNRNHTHATSYHKSSKNVYQKSYASKETISSGDFLLSTITSITKIGAIIMLCSVCLRIFLHYISYAIPSDSCLSIVSTFLVSTIEITNGIPILTCLPISNKLKMFFLLFLTSFGGWSTIFQVKSVLNSCKLSVLLYILSKIIGALFSGLLSFLIL